MGIDARLVLKIVTPKQPTNEQIALWADQLCRSIGARHFFIKDGLPYAEYKKARAAWRKRFEEHPKHPAYRNQVEGARQQIHQDIGPCPEELRRALTLAGKEEGYVEAGSKPGKYRTQDGDTFYVDKADEWLLDVSLWTRFYGVGYERGDLLTICAIAEWAELTLPSCTVYYGGDSSGVCLGEFGHDQRWALKQHYYSKQGRDYFNHRMFGGNTLITPKPCNLCLGAGKFSQYGSGMGGNYIAVACTSCDKNFESRDGGKTWEVKKEED